MQHRTIPGTDLRISLLGFGNFTFGTDWWGHFTDDQAVGLQNHAVERGVNFFDTAPTYGNGRSENLLAATIKHVGRDKLVISTKFGYDIYTDPGDDKSHREKKQDFSEKFIRLDLERSLKRLGIDHIDLYQAHNIRLQHCTGELLSTMQKLQQEGKIRHYGVALGPAIGWREEGHKALLELDAATVQTVFNLYEQDPGRELSEICHKRGRGGIISRVPTNSGILDEEFKSPEHRFPESDHRKFRDRNWLVYGLKKNKQTLPMARQLGISLRQLAFKWLATQPALVSIEPNILRRQDIDDFADVADGTSLPEQIVHQIDNLYADDFALGPDAHPCDLKSSTNLKGVVHSSYQPPTFATT